MNWEAIKLGEFLTLKRGYDLPTSTRNEGVVPVVSSSGITGRHDVAKIAGPGVVTGRYGTLGEVHYVEDDYWPLNTALYVQDFKGNHPRFAAYFLRHVLKGLVSNKAAVPGVNRNVLHEREVYVTRDVDQQLEISAYLSNYDDLIKNNRRRIKLLEEAARLIYREWFVHLRFPGHENITFTDGVPAGWERKRLEEVGFLNYGKGLKKDIRIPGPYPVYGSSGRIDTHINSLIPGPGIIVGRKGTVGSVYWVDEDYHPIDTVYYVATVQSSLFLYYAMRELPFINTDGSVPGLNRNYAHSLELMMPEAAIKAEFEAIASEMHKQIYTLSSMNEGLNKARDILLPRLMSGEITV